LLRGRKNETITGKKRLRIAKKQTSLKDYTASRKLYQYSYSNNTDNKSNNNNNKVILLKIIIKVIMIIIIIISYAVIQKELNDMIYLQN